MLVAVLWWAYDAFGLECMASSLKCTRWPVLFGVGWALWQALIQLVVSLVGVACPVVPALSCIAMVVGMWLLWLVLKVRYLPIWVGQWVVQHVRHHGRQPLASHEMGRA